MSLTREEAERIVTEFDKVANRVEKKTNALNAKMMMGIMVIGVIVIAVVVYLFLYRSKKGKEGKPLAEGKSKSPGVLGPELTGSLPVTSQARASINPTVAPNMTTQPVVL